MFVKRTEGVREENFDARGISVSVYRSSRWTKKEKNIHSLRVTAVDAWHRRTLNVSLLLICCRTDD